MNRIIPLVAGILAFILFSCNKDDTPSPASSTVPHVPPVYQVSLAGQTWTLTQYHDTLMSTVVPAHDTLVFIDSTNYTWNGIAGRYQLEYDSTYVNSQWRFTLCNTPFGIVYATLPPSCFTFGSIPDKLFRCSPSGAYYMWFEHQ
jgi:hypothetical protein